MKEGATRSYKNGQKNNWRRTRWNDVLRRTAGREKTELSLYLAGPEDIDREIAVSKGVPPQNLIAIDRFKPNSDAIRERGLPAIDADVLDILWSWPRDRKVCAVLLDYCGGLQRDNVGVLDAFQRKPLRSAVMMVNFQRGRDAWSNAIRSGMSEAGLLRPLWWVEGNDVRPMHHDTKHRAYQFLMFHALDTINAGVGCGVGQRTKVEQGGTTVTTMCIPETTEGREAYIRLMSLLITRMQPKFYEYRSGVLVFDSAVFVTPWHDALDHDALDASLLERETEFKEPGLVRRLAALMAVRTSRLTGRLRSHA